MSDDTEKQPGGKKSRIVLVAGVFAAFVAGLASLLQNVDAIQAFSVKMCQDRGICLLGEKTVMVEISAADVNGADIRKIFNNEEDGAVPDLSQYSANLFVDKGVEFISFEPERSVIKRKFGNLYYQEAPNQAYYDPAEGAGGWPFGFPILDIMVAENGKAIDITDFEFEVSRSTPDNKPYVQIIAEDIGFGKLLAVDEGNLAAKSLDVAYNAQFGGYGSCDDIVKSGKSAFDSTAYNFSAPFVNGRADINFDEAFRETIPDYGFFKLRHELYENQIYDLAMAKENKVKLPKGYSDWFKKEVELERSESDEGDFDRPFVFGTISAKNETGAYKSYFCGVPMIGVSEVGGGFVSVDSSQLLKLEYSENPYKISKKVNYRIDSADTHFRTQIGFFAPKSGTFDVTLTVKSYDREIYKSRKLRLEIFTPRTTYRLSELKF